MTQEDMEKMMEAMAAKIAAMEATQAAAEAVLAEKAAEAERESRGEVWDGVQQCWIRVEGRKRTRLSSGVVFRESTESTDSKTGVYDNWPAQADLYLAGMSQDSKPLGITSYHAAELLGLIESGDLQAVLSQLAEKHQPFLDRKQAIKDAKKEAGMARGGKKC